MSLDYSQFTREQLEHLLGDASDSMRASIVEVLKSQKYAAVARGTLATGAIVDPQAMVATAVWNILPENVKAALAATATAQVAMLDAVSKSQVAATAVQTAQAAHSTANTAMLDAITTVKPLLAGFDPNEVSLVNQVQQAANVAGMAVAQAQVSADAMISDQQTATRASITAASSASLIVSAVLPKQIASIPSPGPVPPAVIPPTVNEVAPPGTPAGPAGPQ